MLKNKYRSDIDGLRAIAVLAVLFFHLEIPYFGGGFVGVDIFFVISGFLITRLIKGEIDNTGSFDFKRFYVRRIRRLFPALFVTLLSTAIVSAFVFSPSHLERFGGALSSALLSVSNFYFWLESDYFDLSAILKPLLHTWSLSIEEQFYLIWPVSLFFLIKLKKKWVAPFVLLFATFISLYLNLVFADGNVQLINQYVPFLEDKINHGRSTIFFLMPFRIFEFAIGGLLVWMIQYPFKNIKTNKLILFLGIGLIAISVVVFNDKMLFPSYLALFPCVGTALVIYAGNISSPWFLTNKASVSIGLISYSLYLVHWPVIVFWSYIKNEQFGLNDYIFITLLAFFLAYLSYIYVERPFRVNGFIFNGIFRKAVTACLIISVLLVGAHMKESGGWPQRFPDEFFISSKALEFEMQRYWDNSKNIFIGEDKKNVMIMGNSHAIDLNYALKENGADFNTYFLQTSHKCYNFGTPLFKADYQECNEIKVENFKSPYWKTADRVFLHDAWRGLNLIDLDIRLKEIRRLTEAEIYVFGPKMTYTKLVPDIVKGHMRLSTINEYSKAFQRPEHQQINASLNDFFNREKFTKNKIFYVDTLKIQCGENYNNCDVLSKDNNEFLYFDNMHFTLSGATEFGAKLKSERPNLFF